MLLNKENKKTQEKYVLNTNIGSGSFGTVYLANVIGSNQVVAIKKVFQDKKYKNRELQILMTLDHPNIIKIRDYFYSSEDIGIEDHNTEDVYLNVVMDYIPYTLSKFIRTIFKSEKIIEKDDLILYSYQLLRSINYIHAKGICHRDIKPQNILIDINDKVIKLCDFGSAKKLSSKDSNVAYICSRYYRAPELIFNATIYTNAVDVWSIGCVILEMVLGEPLFQGNSSVDQLVEIIKILGTPSKSDIKEMNIDYNQYKFPLIKCFTWKNILSEYKIVDSLFIDLISNIFVYNPNKRYTAFECLAHPYFDKLRIKDNKNENNKLLFEFSKEEMLYMGEYGDKLIPEWYKSEK